ncbi:MAG: DUF4263 domain-containing protein [Chloroflexi bacterium]|nr:DUF4263 domain-containing protein [Chloroflexota bacterium]
MVEEIEYHENKLPGRIYISRPFSISDTVETKGRFISSVYDSNDGHKFVKVNNELVIYETAGGRQEVRAIFYEDDRTLHSLSFVKFEKKSGVPHKHQFTFRGDQITKIYNLLRSVNFLNLQFGVGGSVDQEFMDEKLVNKENLLSYIAKNKQLVQHLIENQVTDYEVEALAYRKNQLKEFKSMLEDGNYIKKMKAELGVNSDEKIWQTFFENNTWIFGYGLSYVFTSPLDDKKLEQVISGANLTQRGKRVDALLKTRGIISSLCIAEIKTPSTKLIAGTAYRPDSWAISSPLAGGIAQSQRSIQMASTNIPNRYHSRDDIGNPVGEEIITFDELYERAKFIVEHSGKSSLDPNLASTQGNDDIDDWDNAEDEIPF